MKKLGSWSTLDCPTENINEAYQWLKTNFEAIGGTVRKITNNYNLGNYFSFEIDYPLNYEFLDDDTNDPEEVLLINKRDEWEEKANELSEEYGELFNI